MEKAQVLSAKHELTIKFILAYALMRSKAEGRSGTAWIPLGMNTGSQGHANGVCLQAAPGTNIVRALVYDPNYVVDGSGSHWVHARKAINDALPGVRRLLQGSGINIANQAELFGHGLQTALGSTSTSRGWFSKTVTTTTRGYPICGSVVFLLAAVWLDVAASGGGRLEDVIQVESTLAEIVADPGGKVMVQQKIAQILRDLTERLTVRGSAPFAKVLHDKFDEDKKDWPQDIVKAGGSINLAMVKNKFEYTW